MSLDITCPHCGKKISDEANVKEVNENEIKDLITWRKDFNIGHDAIDTQHQKLTDMINSLNKAIRSSKRTEGYLIRILVSLGAYAEQHFKTEENIFMTLDYPDKEKHRKQHRKFKKWLDNLNQDFKNNHIELKTILGFLAGWFLEHTQGTDRDLSELLKNKK